MIELKQQGMPYDEIGREMGWSAATARQRYHRALAVLRGKLGDSFGPEAAL